jgi:TRAP-type C4-dicarboxylate transport system permease small subunit
VSAKTGESCVKKEIEKLFLVIKRIDTILGLVAGIGVLVITAIICYEIVARYGFRRPPIWAFDICSYLLLIVAVFSGAYAMAENGHISFTMVLEKLKSKPRRVIMMVGSIFGLAYCILLVSETVKLAAMAVQRNMHTHDQLSIPDIYLYLVILIGAFFLALTFLLKAVVDSYSGDKPDFTSKEY